MTLGTIELVLSLSEPRRILIIEDNVSFALRLRAHYSQLGHTVRSYSGVEGETDLLLGIDPHLPEDPEEINLSEYQACFLDHYFAGDDYNGSSFLAVLGEHPIRVCGMSSVDSANEAMRRLGALSAIRKDRLDQLLSLYRS